MWTLEQLNELCVELRNSLKMLKAHLDPALWHPTMADQQKRQIYACCFWFSVYMDWDMFDSWDNVEKPLSHLDLLEMVQTVYDQLTFGPCVNELNTLFSLQLASEKLDTLIYYCP